MIIIYIELNSSETHHDHNDQVSYPHNSPEEPEQAHDAALPAGDLAIRFCIPLISLNIYNIELTIKKT